MRKTGRIRQLALDLVPALMLGGAVGFLAFVAPRELIERIAVRSHLALLVPEARPPLGDTARMLCAGGLAVGAALATLAAAVVLGRVGRRRTAPPAAPPVFAPAAAAPVLRRADRHPDAPAKRPLLARDELGASFDALDPGTAMAAAPGPPDARADGPPPQRSLPTSPDTVAGLLARLERGVAARDRAAPRAAHG